VSDKNEKRKPLASFKIAKKAKAVPLLPYTWIL